MRKFSIKYDIHDGLEADPVIVMFEKRYADKIFLVMMDWVLVCHLAVIYIYLIQNFEVPKLAP